MRSRITAALAALAMTAIVALPGAARAAQPGPEATVTGTSAVTGRSAVTGPSAVAGASAVTGAVPNARTVTNLDKYSFGIHSWVEPPQMDAGSVRLVCFPNWRAINPAPGVFEWDQMDRIMDRTELWGYKDIMFTFCGVPAWAATAGDLSGVDYWGRGSAAAPDMRAWENVVTAVVKRYKGRIHAYQVWNEVTSKYVWQGTPRQLADMTQRAYKIIKANDPSAVVLSGSMQTHFPKWIDGVVKPYLRELKKRNWPVDVITFHGYASGLNTRYEQLKLSKGIVEALKPPARIALWDTETNHHGDLPRATQMAYVARTYLDSWRLGFRRTYWYMWTPAGDAFTDIQMTPGSPNVRTYNLLMKWVVGSRLQACTSKAGVNKCSFRAPSGSFDIVWANTGKRPYRFRGTKTVCPVSAAACQRAKGRITATLMPVRVA